MKGKPKNPEPGESIPLKDEVYFLKDHPENKREIIAILKYRELPRCVPTIGSIQTKLEPFKRLNCVVLTAQSHVILQLFYKVAKLYKFVRS